MEKIQSTFSVTHIQVVLPRSFEDVTALLEHRLGKLDQSVFSKVDTAEGILSRIKAMEGPDGLMLFNVADHGMVLALHGKPARARQYVLGNPLVAAQMTQKDIRAGLYAPLRLYVYADGGQTKLEYDLPSSLFGQWSNEEVSRVAEDLNKKMESLLDYVSENN